MPNQPVTDLQPLIAASYVALAELLEARPESAWDTPSLCEGWRVREVVAHMTMPARYDEDSFMALLREYDFDFTRLSNATAASDAQLPTGDLIANLRDETLHNWQPPGGGTVGALNHVVIHGLDITVPLHAPRVSSDEAVRVVLDDLTEGGASALFGTDFSGRAFSATDMDWTYGTGAPVRGKAEDIVLHIAGRAVRAERLQ
jgi:uncharacterized protein (TIGR03083 family)